MTCVLTWVSKCAMTFSVGRFYLNILEYYLDSATQCLLDNFSLWGFWERRWCNGKYKVSFFESFAFRRRKWFIRQRGWKVLLRWRLLFQCLFLCECFAYSCLVVLPLYFRFTEIPSSSLCQLPLGLCWIPWEKDF